MKRTLIMMLVLASIGGTTEAYSQSFLKRLGKAVENAAQNAVERNAERATERAVDKAFQKTGEAVEGAVSGNGNNAQPQQAATAAPAAATAEVTTAEVAAAPEPVSLEMTYAKSDFVAGDEIIFEDLLVGEKLGEFPSMWDLKEGNAEIVNVGGENAIHMGEETLIMPYMKEKDYLPEQFTVEFDLYVPCYTGYGGNDKVSMNNRYNIDLVNAAGEVVFRANWYNSSNEM